MNDQAKAATLELAEELDGEFGGGVVAALQDGNKTRDIFAAMGVGATIAGLLMSAVQIVMQWQSDKRIADLEALLNNGLPKPDKVTPEQRTSIIRKVLAKFGGGA